MPLENGLVATFTWNITNCSLCTLRNGEELQSPILSTKTYYDSKWYLTLYPKGIDYVSGYVSVFLRRNEIGGVDEKIPIAFKSEIIDPNGKILLFEEKEEKQFAKGESYGFYKFIKLEKLRDCMKSWANEKLTFRCYLFKNNYRQKPVICDAFTDFTVKKFSFQWKIQIPKTAAWFTAIKVRFQEENEFDFIMTAPKERLFIEIRNSRQQLFQLYKLSIWLRDRKGIAFNSSAHSFETSSKKPYFELETSIKKSQLELLVEGCSCFIDVQFVDSVEYVVSTSDGAATIERYYCGSLLPFHPNFKKMLCVEQHSDVKLRIGNKIIPAHKAVLAARSPVLSTMFFQQAMPGNETTTVDILDVESDIFQYFLEFVYTDKISTTNFENILKLLLVADKYQVNVLKERCLQLLKPKLSNENVCQIISFAEQNNQKDLKLYAFDYVKANRKELVSSLAWSKWANENVELALEIFTKLVIDKSL